MEINTANEHFSFLWKKIHFPFFWMPKRVYLVKQVPIRRCKMITLIFLKTMYTMHSGFSGFLSFSYHIFYFLFDLKNSCHFCIIIFSLWPCFCMYKTLCDVLSLPMNTPSFGLLWKYLPYF
jgi:hypothetical protein